MLRIATKASVALCTFAFLTSALKFQNLVQQSILVRSLNKERVRKDILSAVHDISIVDQLDDSCKLLLYLGIIVVGTERQLSSELLLMSVARLDVLCDVVSFSSHSVGDVWHW
jgi:hypothetical protein